MDVAVTLKGEPVWVKGDGNYEAEETLLPDPRYNGSAHLLDMIRRCTARSAVRASKNAILSGALPDQCNTAGWTALHEAAERGWLQLVSYLITSGADVNFADQYGCTPLHVAVVSEHQHAAHIVMALLKANADPNAGDWYQRTPLHMAASLSSVAMVCTLLCSGADPTARDRTHRSVLSAVPSRSTECAGLIYRWGLLHEWPITMGEYDLVERRITVTHVFPNNDRLVCVSTVAGLTQPQTRGVSVRRRAASPTHGDAAGGGGQQSTGLNHLVGDYVMDKNNLPGVEKVLLVLSVVVSFADFLSDLVVLYEFAMDGETLLFTASVAFVVVVAVYTGALLWGSGRRLSACLQLFQLAPLVDVYHLLRTGVVPNTRVKIGRNSPMIGLFSVHRLKLMEGLLESVPQAVLQTYVGLTSGFTQVLALSVIMSWISLSTSLALSDRREVRYHALASQKRAVTVPWLSWEALVITAYRLVDGAARIATLSVTAAFYTPYMPMAACVDFVLHWLAWTGDEGVCEKCRPGNVLNSLAAATYSTVAFAGCEATRPTWAAPYRTGPWTPSLIALLSLRHAEALALMLLLVIAPNADGVMFRELHGDTALHATLGLLALAVLLSAFYVWRVASIEQRPYFRRGRRRRWASLVAVRDEGGFVGFAQDAKGRRHSILYGASGGMETILRHHGKRSGGAAGAAPDTEGIVTHHNPMLTRNQFAAVAMHIMASKAGTGAGAATGGPARRQQRYPLSPLSGATSPTQRSRTGSVMIMSGNPMVLEGTEAAAGVPLAAPLRSRTGSVITMATNPLLDRLRAARAKYNREHGLEAAGAPAGSATGDNSRTTGDTERGATTAGASGAGSHATPGRSTVAGRARGHQRAARHGGTQSGRRTNGAGRGRGRSGSRSRR